MLTKKDAQKELRKEFLILAHKIENYLKKIDFYMSESIIILKDKGTEQEKHIKILAEKLGVRLEY